MPLSADTPEPERLLGPVGLSDLEERIYRVLLRSEPAALREIADVVGASQRAAREVLESLQQAGLVTRSPTRPARYSPVPPESAVEMLVLRRQEELERVRLSVAELTQEHEARPAPSKSIVEVVAGGEAARSWERQLLADAEEEILAFSLPPFAGLDRDELEEWIEFKRGILKRGVRGRVVYSLDALEIPGVLDFIQALHPAGEEPRAAPHLPMRLLIIDRKAGFVPLHSDKPSILDGRLVVHRSSLLETLVLHFESVWERASTLELAVSNGRRRARRNSVAPSREDQRLLALLAAGMKDAAIARQLGIGPRTVERRLRRLMDILGAQTRFQTAVEACRRGWLGQSAFETRERDR